VTDKASQEPIEAPLEKPAKILVEPFRDFVDAQSGSGWLLLGVTIIAVALANSPWQSLYFDFIHTEFGLTLAGANLRMTLQHWVADGLMAVFFCLLGLELKRELLVGQLSDPRRASSVMCAAIGGMTVPILLFLLVTAGGASQEGWGIPVATDTAFALMVLVLLGERLPIAARAFLVGLAIVDDLGAILFITFAYTGELNTAFIIPAAICAAVLIGLNLTGVRKALPYALVGAVLWLLFLELGLHGTLAGVVVALSAPVRPGISRGAYVNELEGRIEAFQAAHEKNTDTILDQPRQAEVAEKIVALSEEATVPLQRWESALERPVSFFVMPAFAFTSAGVVIAGGSAWTSPLSLAIFVGLLLGKPLGIVVGVWVGKRLNIADLPEGLRWCHIVGLGLLGSIGFTMSLFIAALTFGEGTVSLDTAKQSVIGTSLIAGLIGYAWLRWGCSRK
jgi:NhaA family Na+:H+ antiporter